MPNRLSPAEEALLREFLDRLLAAAPAGAIAAVRVFGSRARGGSGVNSDLDVAVELAPGVPQRSVHYLAADAATDAMMARDAWELALSPLVLEPGPPVGVRGAIARDGVTIWQRPW